MRRRNCASARSHDNLKYVPNVAARNLVLQSSATFGLMTPDVNDPIHGQVVTGFQQQAAEHDYSVILSNGFGDDDTERRALREFAAHRVAAVAVMGSVLPQVEVKRIMLSPSPVLFIGSEHVRRPASSIARGAACVPTIATGCDRWLIICIERGYRSIAYVSGSTGATEDHPPRQPSLPRWLNEADPTPVVHRADNADAEGLRVVAAEIRKSRPDVSRLLRRQDSPPADGRTSDRRA